MAAGSERYSAPAIALHWLIALLMCCGFGLGLYMVELGFSPQKLSFYSYHKWIGVTVFSLALLRLLWRFAHRPPPLPASVAPWQQAVSGATHVLLHVAAALKHQFFDRDGILWRMLPARRGR